MLFVCTANCYKYRSTWFREDSIAASIFGNVITGRITICPPSIDAHVARCQLIVLGMV